MKCKRCDDHSCKICKQRIRRQQNPVKYAYDTLKHNAKRRGHEFDLTFEQFAKFAVETNYIGKRGKRSNSYSIDRKDNDKGYTINNIQILTLSENSRKSTKVLQAWYDEKERKVVATVEKFWFDKLVEQCDDDPF